MIRSLRSGAALHASGPPGAPALLFLHGVGGGAWSWEPQVATFAPTHRIYVWEARGHGQAARVDDAGLSDYYTDAKEALDAIMADGCDPPVIVAHSMGGLLAIALGCDRADEVRGLFLLDPVYSDGDSDSYGHMPRSFARIALFLCEPLLASYRRNGPLSRFLSRRFFALAFRNRDRMEAAWVHQRTQIPVEYQRMLRESFTRPEGFTPRDFAGELALPVEIVDCVRGKESVRFPDFEARLRERLGDRFRSTAIRAGHYVQLDEPDAVNAELASFLAWLQDRERSETHDTARVAPPRPAPD